MGSILFYDQACGAGFAAVLNSASDYKLVSDVAGLGKDWTNVRKGAGFSDQEACSTTGLRAFCNTRHDSLSLAQLDDAGRYSRISTALESGGVPKGRHLV